jgi:hypothetical protein
MNPAEFDSPTGRHAILVGHQVKECNLMTWARWFEATSALDERRVGLDEVSGVRISTIFLGLDHQLGSGPKLWFETMVFPGDDGEDSYMARYSTWAQAEAGHAAAVAMVAADAKVAAGEVLEAIRKAATAT